MIRFAFRPKIRTALLAGSLLALAPLSRPAPAQTLETNLIAGLHTLSFPLPGGSVQIYLPEDLASGDRIVYRISPYFPSPEQAEGYRVEVSGQPAYLFETFGYATIPMDAGSVRVAVRDPEGRTVAARELAVLRYPEPPPRGFQFPEVIQGGEPFSISGPFNGDPRTVVRIAGQEAPVLANNPRRLVAINLSERVGIVPIYLEEDGEVLNAQLRNLAVRTYLEKTRLRPEEQALATLAVAGLDALAKPVDVRLRLDSDGRAAMEGGNLQTLTIHPGMVAAGGIFVANRLIIAAGIVVLGIRAQVAGHTPEFSCCEKKIEAKGAGQLTQVAVRHVNGVTILTFDVKLKLTWECENRELPCWAYYLVSVEHSQWAEKAGQAWVEAPKGSIREYLLPGLPLKEKCDGKKKGPKDWGFRYEVHIDTSNPVRNLQLVLRLSVRKDKGVSSTRTFLIPEFSGRQAPAIEGPKEGNVGPADPPPPQTPSTPQYDPGSTPTRPAGFSCCEKEIRIDPKKTQISPLQRNKQAGTVSFNVKVKLHWKCDKKDKQECLAFYRVGVAESHWQQLDPIQNVWVDIPAPLVQETIKPADPRKETCDGKPHDKDWGFTYEATVQSPTRLRNPKLIFQLYVPPYKGSSYKVDTRIRDVEDPNVELVEIEDLELPSFSCCETNIEVDGRPQVTSVGVAQVGANGQILTTVTLDVSVPLKWFCADDPKRKDCRGFYEVLSWITWNAPVESTTIIPAAPLREDCDGKQKTGVWKFRYQAQLRGAGPFNANGEFSLLLPPNKGVARTITLKLTNVAGAGETQVELELKP